MLADWEHDDGSGRVVAHHDGKVLVLTWWPVDRIPKSGIEMVRFDPTTRILRIFPKTFLLSNEGQQFSQVHEFQIDTGAWAWDPDEPVSENVYRGEAELVGLPDGFGKIFQYGLGLVRQYRGMIYAIEEHTECNVVRFGASDAEGPNGNTFHIAIERFAQYKHDVDLNIRRAQVVVRRIIAAESFNSIADLLGKARVMPTLGRHPTIQAITRALTDDVPLDTEERTALVGRMSAESSKAARENPPAFGKLRQDIDLVTLEVLIEQYRSGLQGKAAEDESWWQEFFRTNTFALQQLFSAPVALFKDQAHVRVTNAGGGGGRVADFVLVNTVARTVVAVEIKTPGTKLLGSRYRGAGGGEVYLPHKELSGAVAQIQAQLESVVTDFPQIVTNSPGLDSIDTADVRGAVIIGKLESLEAEEKRDSFIRYRARLLGIDVLTFDEVYHRLCGLHTMLSNEHGGVSSATSAR